MYKFRYIVIVLLLLPVIAGCSHNAGPQINGILTLDFMKYKLETKTIDLAIDGQCPGTLPLFVVNNETRTEPHVFLSAGGHTHYVMPIEFIDLVSRHLSEKLSESHIKMDGDKGRKILMSLEEAKVEGTWVFEATVTIKVEIPDAGYAHSYSGVEGSPNGYHALCYAAHLAVNALIKDAAFQKFVQCR